MYRADLRKIAGYTVLLRQTVRRVEDSCLDAIAQLVERWIFNPLVAGSNPVRGVTLTR